MHKTFVNEIIDELTAVKKYLLTKIIKGTDDERYYNGMYCGILQALNISKFYDGIGKNNNKGRCKKW